jgi:phosphoglycolate phosphatase-like HAD superfamily hydrolase
MNFTIVFDLDGTLITCENKHKYVLFSIINGFNRIDTENLNKWWEFKRDGLNTEQALIKIGIPHAYILAEKWKNNIENYIWTFLDSPFNDSLSSLSFLNNAQIKCVILTARKNVYHVRQVVNRCGFNEHIDDLIVVNPVNVVQEKGKHLAKIKPLLYIGDSELDYLAAINSGTRFIALSRGQRSKDFLNKSGDMQIEENLKFLKKNDFINQLKKL